MSNVAWLRTRFGFTDTWIESDNSELTVNALDRLVLIDRIRWLSQRLPITKKELGSIIRNNPSLLRLRSNENLEPKLAFLQKEFNCSNDVLTKLIKANPRILKMGTNSQALRRNLDWASMRLQLKEKDTEILAKCIPVLHLSAEDNLEPTVIKLQERLGIDDFQVAKLLRRHPGVLAFNVTRTILSIDWYEDRLQLTQAGLASIFVRHPALLNCNTKDNIEPTLNYLQRRLDIQDDAVIGDMIRRSPSLLSYNTTTNIGPKLDFLEACLGKESVAAAMTQYPRVLTASLKRLGPRLEQIYEVTEGVIDAALLNRMACYPEERWQASIAHHLRGKKLPPDA